MRIAYSALFISLCEGECAVALLSQLFLKDQQSLEYRVPIYSWKLKSPDSVKSSDPNLVAIHQVFFLCRKSNDQYSPFSKFSDLAAQFETLQERGSGMRIVLFDLKQKSVFASGMRISKFNF
jgi:hypothetical protein